jgi:hypothetical protein
VQLPRHVAAPYRAVIPPGTVPGGAKSDLGKLIMKTMVSMIIMAISAMLTMATPAAAGPGLVLQGPSTNGITYDNGKPVCPTWQCGFNSASTNGFAPLPASSGPCSVWRCGFNGVSLNGLTLNGLTLNGLTLNGLTLNGARLNDIKWNGLTLNGKSLNGNGKAATGFATTAVTLPNGEVLAID